MKCIAYYRVSTTKQGIDGYGIQAQKDAVARYLKSRPDAELVASFSEVESGKVNTRPELAKAIQLCKSQGHTLLIAKLDRLSRQASFLLSLQDSNLDFVCCDMPSADKFTIGILGLVAQREREMISQRTKAGLAVAKARGVTLGNPRLSDARINAKQAIQTQKLTFIDSVLKPIREIQSTGIQSYNRIADYLNKRGERSPRGKTWTATAVRRVVLATKA